MMFRPVVFIWDGPNEVMRLAPRFGEIARKQFVDGEKYPLEVREQRSSAEHAHYFASVNQAWQNLDEESSKALITPEHLRKWALIESGWYEETLIDCGSRDVAIRMAVFARKHDDYAEIKVMHQHGIWFLRIRDARSQSRAAMNKEAFQQSKRDVLAILAGQIHVTRKELEQAGRTG